MKLRWNKEEVNEWGEVCQYVAKYKGLEIKVIEYDSDFEPIPFEPSIEGRTFWFNNDGFATRREANVWCYKWIPILLEGEE